MLFTCSLLIFYHLPIGALICSRPHLVPQLCIDPGQFPVIVFNFIRISCLIWKTFQNNISVSVLIIHYTFIAKIDSYIKCPKYYLGTINKNPNSFCIACDSTFFQNLVIGKEIRSNGQSEMTGMADCSRKFLRLAWDTITISMPLDGNGNFQHV